jgi:hypothetical protein
MARIEVQPTAVPVRVEQRLREGLLVVAATLVFSLLILLASVSVLAIFAPTTALMLFGAVVSGLVSLFSVSGDVVAWAASTTASEVMLASLAFIASVSLLIRAGIIRDSRHAPREA